MTLAALAKNSAKVLRQTLVIVVVNQRENAATDEKTENRKTLDWLASQPCPELQLAWVAACEAGCELTPREGVGMARKIGLDLSLARLDWTQDPLLISLDADTLVDRHYLSAIRTHFNQTSAAGAVLPYRHQQGASSQIEAAIRNYELYLRSYQLGLELAASPYAFTAIGSAFACRAPAYVACGGMKRRLAGEDFYFLQHLAKQGGLSALCGTLVQPAARFSERVPFGTGPVIAARVREGRSLYSFISKASFARLRDFLQRISCAVGQPAEQIRRQIEQQDAELGHFLERIDFCSNWQKLQHNTSPAAFLSAWHNWFDGLRTRQLLHQLEAPHEGLAPELLVADLLAAAGFSGLTKGKDQLRKLEEMQQVYHTAGQEE